MHLLFLLTTAGFLLFACVFAAPQSLAEAGKPTPVLVYTTQVWGDILCSGEVDSSDTIPVLRRISQLEVLGPSTGCPWLLWGIKAEGYQVDSRWGDVDCNNDIGLSDVMAILKTVAVLPVEPIDGCPTPGAMVPVAITGK
ncbi:MAG: hypothetical protein AAB092_05190 [Chloroflexota bacterium]